MVWICNQITKKTPDRPVINRATKWAFDISELAFLGVSVRNAEVVGSNPMRSTNSNSLLSEITRRLPIAMGLRPLVQIRPM